MPKRGKEEKKGSTENQKDNLQKKNIQQVFEERENLKLSETIHQHLSHKIPEGWQIGAAYGRGDCFFDAVAQAINHNQNDEAYTVKSLRLLCEKYVKNENNTWVKTAVEQDKDNWENYLARVPFTAEEMKENDHQNVLTGIATWGRPSIEGVMICEKMGIQIHSIEVLEELVDGVYISEHCIDAKGSRSVDEIPSEFYENLAYIHLIVHRNHFVPLTKVFADTLQSTQSTGQCAGNSQPGTFDFFTNLHNSSQNQEKDLEKCEETMSMNHTHMGAVEQPNS